MKNFFVVAVLISMYSSSLEAREEVVLTMAKSGTHYLKKIVENMTDCKVIHPTVPIWFHQAYARYNAHPRTIVFGHCEPSIMNRLPQKERVLLLIRDPRDLALSAVDFIDNGGLAVWPGLSKVLNRKQWDDLSKIEKLSLILEDYYTNREVSIVNLFESAVQLTQQKDCVVVKYESLSPEFNTLDELTVTLQAIGYFFGETIDSFAAENILMKSFKNEKSLTFNQGKAFRYKDEDEEILNFLETKLSKYIHYFEYPLER